jgi:hypothetical protein
MSDRVVDIGPVEQHAPSTSSQPSLACPGQWIRNDTVRYTQQGAAFRVLKIVSPTALAPPTLKSKRVPTSVLRTVKINHRLQKPPSPRAARHTAPHRASGRSCPPPTSSKLRPHMAWSCAADTHNPLEITLQPILTPNHSTNPTQSLCPRPLTTSPITDKCSCGIARSMRLMQTSPTPRLASRDIRSHRSSRYLNHPLPSKP